MGLHHPPFDVLKVVGNENQETWGAWQMIGIGLGQGGYMFFCLLIFSAT